jgi:hypothetical protein
MGTSLSFNANGNLVRDCDNCGQGGGTRKRACTAKVTSSNLRSQTRQTLGWCPAPSLCSPCFKAIGGSKVLHKDCHAPAAQAQAQADAEQARLDAGDKAVISARMLDHGSVEVTFAGPRYSDHITLIMQDEQYDHVTKPFLSDYTGDLFLKLIDNLGDVPVPQGLRLPKSA